MATLLEDIVEIINDRRRDTTANSVDMTEEGFRAIGGALEIWDSQHDWPWQRERHRFQYNEGIDTYPISTSLNFKALVDIEPQKNPKTEFYFLGDGKFDTDTTHTYKMAVRNEDGKRYLRVKYTGNMAVLNAASDNTSNGTWVGASAISNVAKDSYESFNQTSSIKFDYSGTSGTLTNSTMTAVDVSQYAQRSTLYFDVYLQSVTNFTSITLKVGSSASDYITGAITTDYLGNDLTTGWNRVSLTWDGSTTVVGTLDEENFDYIQVTIAYSSNPSTVSNRIENFFISENVPMDLDFYSHNMVYDVSGTTKLLKFNDATATATDYPLWSGDWDFVNEAFFNSVLEIIFWMTGETDDRAVAIQRIQGFVEPLKTEMPSKRRYRQIQMTPDLNL